MSRPDVHYSDYLQLEKILDAQLPESDKEGVEAHDEMLFIIIHQAYELWFKQLLYETDSILRIMSGPVNDNSSGMQTVVHRAERMNTILRVLVQQIDILETMTPMDFLDFRDLLRPASGFQSWQFKILEAKLGLRYPQRHGQQYYVSQLRPAQVQMIREVEEKPTLLELVNSWLERMPFFDESENWANYKPLSPAQGDLQVFWSDYRQLYAQSLVSGETQNLDYFDKLFLNTDSSFERQLSAKASRAALFIMLYRGYPILHQPFRVLNALLDADELLATWRFRHMNMVHRMIGGRVGTGGSTGKEYLRGALEKHYIYKELAGLTSYLIERRKLPVLSQEMESRLGFR